jgi:F-type H+-transporting ATPase subunit gamma
MAGSKEIRTKIKSVQSTRKITKAMEMVAASKMKRAQDRMRAARPYVGRTVADRCTRARQYGIPASVFAEAPAGEGRGTDRGHRQGLRGGPTPTLRSSLSKIKAWQAQGIAVTTPLGNKGLGFMQRLKANIVSQVINLGDRPHPDKIIAGESAARSVPDGKIDGSTSWRRASKTR